MIKKQLLLTITLCTILISSITFCSETPQPSYWKRFTTWINNSVSNAQADAIRMALVPLTWGFALSHNLTTEQTAALYGIQGGFIYKALHSKDLLSLQDVKEILMGGLATAGTIAILKPSVNKFLDEAHKSHPIRITLENAIDNVKTLFDNEYYHTTQLKIDAIERLKKYDTEEISRRTQNPKLGLTYNLETEIQACDIVIKELKENK